MKSKLTFLFLFIFLGVNNLSADEKMFSEANKAYELGNYKEASQIYEKLARENPENFSILFNLGTSYLKMGLPGRAIASYRMAQKLSPRDPGLAVNLRYARDQIPTPPGRTVQENPLDRVRTAEWMLGLTAMIWLFFLLLGLRQIFPKAFEFTRALCWILGAGSLALLTICVISHLRSQQTMAVVVSKEAAVRRGPFDESQAAFSLKEGREIPVTGTKEEWCEINDGPNKVGWVHSINLNLIIGR